MFGEPHTEVLIVGAGPVGLFSAILLAERGLGVHIVDEEWRTAKGSYALALHPHSIRLFDELNLAKKLLASAYRIDRIGLHDGPQLQQSLDLSRLETPFPFVLVMPQKALEDLLEAELDQHDIKVDWSHRVSSLSPGADRVAVQIEKLGKDSTGYSVSTTSWVVDKTVEMTADFVIGADGHRSAVRRALEIPYSSAGGSQLFGVFEFDTGFRPNAQVDLVLAEDSTNVLWPLKENRVRWSFELVGSDEYVEERAKSRLLMEFGGDAFPVLSLDKLKSLVAQRAPWFGEVGDDLDWSVVVQFDRRLVRNYGEGRVWLAGDAAHLAPPAGVQSMNVAFREARDLADRIYRVAKKNRPLSLLEEYGAHWTTAWQEFFELANHLEYDDSASPWVRQTASRLPLSLPASGKELESLLGQLGVRLPASAAISDGSSA